MPFGSQGVVCLGYELLLENSRALAAATPDMRLGKSSPLLLFVCSSCLAGALGATLLMPVVQYALLYRSATHQRRTVAR